MLKKLLVISVALFFSVGAIAQVNEQEAFKAFKQARAAYNNGDYETSSRLLSKTKELLGRTNIRIQPMLIKSLVKTRNWSQAQTEVENYYALNPSTDLVEYQEITTLKVQIDKQVEAEKRRQRAAARRKEAARLAAIEAARKDLSKARRGNVDAMERIARRYESGDGVTQDYAQARDWKNKATNIRNERKRVAHNRQIDSQLDDISYFPNTTGLFKDMTRGGGIAKDGPVMSISYAISAPFWTVASFASDVLSSEPVNATIEKSRLNNLKIQAALRPSRWAKPDSLIARASTSTNQRP